MADQNFKADPSLNTTHISSNLRSYEAARSGFFVFVVDTNSFKNAAGQAGKGVLYRPDVQNQATEPADSIKVYTAQTVSDSLRLNVVKASVPTFSVATQEYRRGNDVVKFAGVPTYEEGSLTVDDVVGMETKNILYSWLYLAYNPYTRKGGRMKDYKKTCTLIEYTQDYEMVRSWTLYGCFVTKIGESEFDRENDGKRQLSVSISYDRAEMSLPNSPSWDPRKADPTAYSY